MPCLYNLHGIYLKKTINNHGGLKHRKVESKQVYHQNVLSVVMHRPQEVKTNVFYVVPILVKSDKLIGVNSFSTNVKRLCGKGWVSGYKTNQSLRFTSASRLFQSGADE